MNTNDLKVKCSNGNVRNDAGPLEQLAEKIWDVGEQQNDDRLGLWNKRESILNNSHLNMIQQDRISINRIDKYQSYQRYR